jgi:hypothetical protein
MKHVIEMSSDERYARCVELYNKLTDACVGSKPSDALGASYNLLLMTTMHAKQCDELEAVEDIIHVSYELIERIEDEQIEDYIIEGGKADQN